MSQAESEKAQLLADVQPRTRLGRKDLSHVLTVGFVALLIGGVGLGLDIFSPTVAVVEGACLAFTFVLGVSAWFSSGINQDDRELQRQDIVRQFTEVDVHQLKRISEIANELPDVAEAVRCWLKDGKVLLNRDAIAIFDYYLAANPARQKIELLSALSGRSR